MAQALMSNFYNAPPLVLPPSHHDCADGVRTEQLSGAAVLLRKAVVVECPAWLRALALLLLGGDGAPLAVCGEGGKSGEDSVYGGEFGKRRRGELAARSVLVVGCRSCHMRWGTNRPATLSVPLVTVHACRLLLVVVVS